MPEFLPRELVATWVGVYEGIVAAISVSIESLWIRGGLDDCVRLGEAAQGRVVVTRPVVIQSGRVVESFASELRRKIFTPLRAIE